MRLVVRGDGYVGWGLEWVIGPVGRSGFCWRSLVGVVAVVIAAAALLKR